VVAVLVALAGVLVVGSVAEIHAQSASFRTGTDAGYGQLASLVAEDSTRTGSQLGSLMDTAAQLPNRSSPRTARAEIQQGLDQAVSATADQEERAAALVPPYPTGTVSERFTQVMEDRAAAAAALRSSIDRFLGLAPLPVAGAPAATEPASTAPLTSVDQATAAMTAAGVRFEEADREYRQLNAYVRAGRIPVHLPPSVWVTAPVDEAPLGPTGLGATASALSTSAALVPFHQLVITAVGLSPPSVPSGSAGVVGDGCTSPASTVPTSATVLPPTGSVTVTATLTNCGTVEESGVAVSQILTLSDPPGTPLPPSDARGSRSTVRATLPSGASTGLDFPTLTVSGGHLYTLTLSVALPTNQDQDAAGSTQQLLLQIAG
jgi:hypothetical protein